MKLHKYRYQVVGEVSPLLAQSKEGIAKKIYKNSRMYHMTNQTFEEWLAGTSKRITIQFGCEMIYENADQFVDQLEFHGLIRRLK